MQREMCGNDITESLSNINFIRLENLHSGYKWVTVNMSSKQSYCNMWIIFPVKKEKVKQRNCCAAVRKNLFPVLAHM